MKYLLLSAAIILFTLVSFENINDVNQGSCVSAFEDTETYYGTILVHMLTRDSGSYYYCTYDTTTLVGQIFTKDSTDYLTHPTKLWTIKESFGTNVEDGYDCFLDEIAFRGITLP